MPDRARMETAASTGSSVAVPWLASVAADLKQECRGMRAEECKAGEQEQGSVGGREQGNGSRGV